MSLRSGFSYAGILEEIFPANVYKNYSIQNETLSFDEFWMLEAYKEAKKGIGFCSPNPAVGCVIIKNGIEISRGFTQSYGNEHAKKNAIDKVYNKEILNGATIYVTLEPCCHHGKQPSCANLLVKYKIKKCVIGIIDPNPKVCGQGIDFLKLNGIEVIHGILKTELQSWYLPFIIHTLQKRPAIIAKWAQSLNGLLANDSMESKWISGSLSKYYTHFLRQKYDAIIIAKNTLLLDTPELTARDEKSYALHQPIRIVYDPNLDLLECSEELWIKLNQKFFTNVSKIILLCKSKLLKELSADRYESLMRTNNIKFLFLNEDEIKIKNIIHAFSKIECVSFIGK
jgi:diaminohydroxyphosphoribosylaminopyrimidine deaminase/5-amino-6-(5-phosphoribosylamino)uracil reductase